jgi:broad specificity phosphatase PhoE
MTLIYFVRHGESHANRLHVFSNREAPHGLTDIGRAQVAELAERLADVRFGAFYSSPLLRARQSADIVAERLGLEYVVTSALAEYDVGILEGRSDQDSWDRYAELHATWISGGNLDARHEGGESYRDVCQRFAPLLHELRSTPSHGPVLLMGHGGTFNCVLSHFCVNVDPTFAFRRGIGHTEVVITELSEARLICLTWGSQ